jgi:hypothetical protein
MRQRRATGPHRPEAGSSCSQAARLCALMRSYAQAGADRVTFQWESVNTTARALALAQRIRAAGMRAGRLARPPRPARRPPLGLYRARLSCPTANARVFVR